MAPNFDKTISTREQLRAVLGEPSPRVLSKVIDHIDVHCRRFIAKSPFLLLATANVEAWMHAQFSEKWNVNWCSQWRIRHTVFYW